MTQCWLYIGRSPVGHDALAEGRYISLSLALLHASYLTVSQAEGGRRFMRIEDAIMGRVLEEGVGWWENVSRRRSPARASIRTEAARRVRTGAPSRGASPWPYRPPRPNIHFKLYLITYIFPEVRTFSLRISLHKRPECAEGLWTLSIANKYFGSKIN